MMPYKSVKSLALILLLYIIQWAVLSLNESLNLSVIVCVCLTDEKRQSAYLWLTVYFSKFCFCVLYGTLPTILKKLQYIHNSATLPLTHPITPVLQNLIRLTVNQQIHLRLLLITYKALNKIGSPYLTKLLHWHSLVSWCQPPVPLLIRTKYYNIVYMDEYITPQWSRLLKLKPWQLHVRGYEDPVRL